MTDVEQWAVTAITNVAIPTISAVVASVIAANHFVTRAENRFTKLEEKAENHATATANLWKKLDKIQDLLTDIKTNCAAHGFNLPRENKL
jgi:hypothetical protein